MSKLALAAAATLAAILAAGAAQAQTQSQYQRVPTETSTTGGAAHAYMIASNMNGNLYARGLRQVVEEDRLERAAESRDAALRRYGADRLALADQVQAQIDAGQCVAARQMAIEAGDMNMAIRVRQTCRS